MIRSRAAASVVSAVAISLGSLAAATPAHAVTTQEKLQVLSSWSQTSAASQSTWLAARNNQGAWSAYGFDWSTDYCSDSPDQPLGFDFRLPCARHDFGYRNYRDLGQFAANKARVDSAFYEDLKRVCATYSTLLRSTCNGLAAVYYNAVKLFGGLSLPAATIQGFEHRLAARTGTQPVG
jgi:hypothetical protein